MQSILYQIPCQVDHYNELLDANGLPHPHWQALIETLANEPASQMRHRVEAIQRQVRDNGVTYNVYADTNGLQRPWDLDALPFILPHEEWTHIAAAVAQRATLLNQVLLDIYGAQQTLSEGLLPSALVHGHAGFLRPCHGVQHEDNIALHLYAVDIARAPNGQWWVVSDRTQAPTGAGYALENRTIISSAFPDLFRDLNIQRLSGFFTSMRDSLSHWGRLCAQKQSVVHPEILSLSEGEQPLIVILTPGPYNETYHEQSYLAGYLGFPLVQGSDLTVRNGIVWLKTISGLKAVHVILRRLDDDFCDPLELNADSLLGVAGLAQATRQGHVVIANSLGSNILQSGALLGFLPKLCERFLGESLKMPSVATWWCGEPSALETVIANLHELVIKPAFPQINQHPIFGEDLTAEGRDALIEKLRENPQNYIAQEQVKISQAPAWSAHHKPNLNSLAIGLRVYACATPNGYAIMPGGLARIASGKDERVITMQRGGTSKDTWITSPTATYYSSLLRRTMSSRDLVRGNTYLSSRMVENLFWFGRYTIRNGHTTRLIRIAIQFLMEFSGEHRPIEWTTLRSVCMWYGLIPDADVDSDQDTSAIEPDDLSDEEIERQLIHAVFSSKDHSLQSSIQQFFQLAFNIRERLSGDNWRIINQMSQRFTHSKHMPTLTETLEHLNETSASLVTLSGFTLDGMTRDQGWRFMSLGRRIERLQFLCVLLQHALTMPPESNLDWLLELTDSIVTYRARYSAQPEWLPVLDLLLMDEHNPNAMIFQLKGMVKYLAEVSANYGGGAHEAVFIERLESLKALDPDLALYHGSSTLLIWLNDTYKKSIDISDQLNLRFFSYSGLPAMERY
ncbi:circularly permuted type 2 ATP-grasp protein [Methylotenera sp. N17]|uniref:circularly permuted type 2 ATP-grasp protein n=1 Tax=Methylotenera sp. N17 TaxID=1502761 RepID=UPI0006490AB8|nr:circularly permuted type 2 ATP-grasp protein [Methylotenera sp. N17]